MGVLCAGLETYLLYKISRKLDNMVRSNSLRLLFSIGELHVLGEAWDKYRERYASAEAPQADKAVASSVSEKLDDPTKTTAFTSDEALLLASAMELYLDQCPSNMDGGITLGRSEFLIIKKLIMLRAQDS